MKVLYVQPTGDRKGHYGLNTTKICYNLSKIGVKTVLVTNEIFPEKFINKSLINFSIFKYDNGKLKFPETKSKLKIYYSYYKNSLLVGKYGLEIAKKEKVDLIHFTGLEFGVLSFLLKTSYRKNKLDIPVTVEISAANFGFNEYSGNFLEKLYKSLQKKIFITTIGKEVKGIYTLGEFHKRKLRKQLKLSDNFPIVSIPDGGDILDFEISKEEARKKLSLPLNKKILLFFGLIRKDKGIEFLLKALSFLNEDIITVIAGKPVDYDIESIKNLIRKYDLSRKVIFRPVYIPDELVDYYFYSADFVIFPYRSFYTGGTGPFLKGACMHKRLAIVANVSEMGRLAIEEGIAIPVEPENPLSIAEGIKKAVFMSDSERKCMVNKAYNYAKRFSWENVAKDLKIFWEKLIK